jgi:hypothetical protein
METIWHLRSTIWLVLLTSHTTAEGFFNSPLIDSYKHGHHVAMVPIQDSTQCGALVFVCATILIDSERSGFEIVIPSLFHCIAVWNEN